ncbi:MAG: prepilin-type N-terminal cleavage/methylation domain-containing protein [Proteobacteria bacterium]|nr:prepilin-type N-terminal cleavage/methylation domain-containing protein [Pseudomonadota bacterium]
MTSPYPKRYFSLPIRSYQAGFTLLEILLALSMFALLMSILYMTIGQSMDLVSRTEQQGEIYAMARTAMLRIQEDLEAIPLLPPLKDSENNPVARRQFILTDQTDKSLDNDTIQFISRANVPAGNTRKFQAQGTLITYSAEKTTDSTLTLFRTATPLESEEQHPSSEDRAILCELLTGIDFKCADGHNQEYSSWDSNANPESGIPQRVTVTLRFHDPTAPSGDIHFTTSFLIPVSANR